MIYHHGMTESVRCVLAVSDHHADTGCLTIKKGSHLLLHDPLSLQVPPASSAGTTSRASAEEEAKGDTLRFVGQAGDLLLVDCRAWHCTTWPSSSARRPAATNDGNRTGSSDNACESLSFSYAGFEAKNERMRACGLRLLHQQQQQSATGAVSGAPLGGGESGRWARQVLGVQRRSDTTTGMMHADLLHSGGGQFRDTCGLPHHVIEPLMQPDYVVGRARRGVAEGNQARM